MNIAELKDKNIKDLAKLAKKYNIDGAAGMRKQDLIFALLQAQIEKKRTDLRRRNTGNPARRLRLPPGADL
jgi:transcription termination factor Rho